MQMNMTSAMPWYIIQSVIKLLERLQAKYKQYCDNVSSICDILYININH